MSGRRIEDNAGEAKTMKLDAKFFVAITKEFREMGKTKNTHLNRKIGK